MRSKDEALSLLDRALEAATTAGCDAADAALLSRAGALTRFANNTIHQNVAMESATLCLRAVRGRRTGCVRTGVLDDSGIADAARRAADIAAVSAEDPDFPGLVESPHAEPCGVFDPAAAAATPAQRAEAVRAIIACIEGGGAVASGSLSTGSDTLAVANTAGTRQFDRDTGVRLNIVAMADTAAGCAEFYAQRLGEMDAPERAEFALKKCLDSHGAGEIEPGEYAVVLEPPAVADMARFLARLGFNAQDMQQGRSCLQGKLGEKVCDERISVVDDPRDPAGSPFAFDGEGVPRQRVELLAGGVFKNVVHDTRSAAKEGVASTGNGGVPPNPYGPHPGTLIISPGTESLDELIGSTPLGLLVSNFHYTNVAERSTCTITGMTRYGLFEIVDGRVARAVRNLRFTQSVLSALGEVQGVGSARERLGPVVAPALKVGRFRFTGTSDH